MRPHFLSPFDFRAKSRFLLPDTSDSDVSLSLELLLSYSLTTSANPGVSWRIFSKHTRPIILEWLPTFPSATPTRNSEPRRWLLRGVPVMKINGGSTLPSNFPGLHKGRMSKLPTTFEAVSPCSSTSPSEGKQRFRTFLTLERSPLPLEHALTQWHAQ